MKEALIPSAPYKPSRMPPLSSVGVLMSQDRVNFSGHVRINLFLLGLNIMVLSATDFFSVVTYGTSALGPSAIELGDINGDGFLDAVTANKSGADSISIFFGVGDGTFGAPTNITINTRPSTIAIADLNDDGRADILVGRRGGFSIVTRDTFGNFSVSGTGGTSPVVTGVHVADINNDGKNDFVTSAQASNYSDVYIWNGTAQAAAGPLPNIRVNDFAFGDLNGDGKIDIVTSNTDLNTFSVLIGDGVNTFNQLGGDINIGPDKAGQIRIADMNNDGKLDFIAKIIDGRYGVAVAFGNGNGTFQGLTYYELNRVSTASELEIADLDGDGFKDVILGHNIQDGLFVFRGSATGILETPFTLTAGQQPIGIAIGDLNGDGKLDVVTANADAQSIGVLLQKNVAPVVTPVSVTSNPSTPSSGGGNNIQVTAPSELSTANGTSGIDTLFDSIMQPLKMPSNIENIVLSGGGGRNIVAGNTLDNLFTITSGNWQIVGDGGDDTVVFPKPIGAYSIRADATGIYLSGPDGDLVLRDVDHIKFGDKTLDVVSTPAALNTYRLYLSAFGRGGDLEGASFWAGELTSGRTTLESLASKFVASKEFNDRYGALANADFVRALYQNVLGRPADPSGADVWLKELNSGLDRGSLLARFATSAEAQQRFSFFYGDSAMILRS